MSFRGKNFLCWLWIGALLTASVGISVHKLYCYCVGKTTVTLFATGEDACAERASATVDCCKKPAADKPSCCREKSDSAPGIHSKCTDEKTEVFQLKEEYLTEHPTVKTLDCPTWLAELPMFKRFFRPALCHFERPLLLPDAAGPPLSGRDICVRDQVFRI